MARQRQILVTVTYNDLGCILDTKAEPYEEPNLQPACNQLATDAISRQAAIDMLEKAMCEDGFRSETGLIHKTTAYEIIRHLPSAHSKQLQVLADVLDGCPLTQPCDKMWKPEGWCKEHCKPGQQEPDAECWLKYAEVMAADDT